MKLSSCMPLTQIGLELLASESTEWMLLSLFTVVEESSF